MLPKPTSAASSVQEHERVEQGVPPETRGPKEQLQRQHDVKYMGCHQAVPPCCHAGPGEPCDHRTMRPKALLPWRHSWRHLQRSLVRAAVRHRRLRPCTSSTAAITTTQATTDCPATTTTNATTTTVTTTTHHARPTHHNEHHDDDRASQTHDDLGGHFVRPDVVAGRIRHRWCLV